VLNGTVAPTTEGVDGDFFINTTTSTIYGPKTGGVWGAGTSLIGPPGPAGSAITATPTIVVNSGNSPYTVTATDYTMFCNTSSGSRVVNLPAAAGNTGRLYLVRLVGNLSNTCTVNGVAGGAAVLQTGAFNRRAITVQSDGASWWTVSESYN
jgi:hypothetical protein